MQVGKTKDQGLYNKPSAAVHPGELTAGTLLQYSTIPQDSIMNTYCILSVSSFIWPFFKQRYFRYYSRFSF